MYKMVQSSTLLRPFVAPVGLYFTTYLLNTKTSQPAFGLEFKFLILTFNLSSRRGIPNYDFKVGRITFIRNSRPQPRKFVDDVRKDFIACLQIFNSAVFVSVPPFPIALELNNFTV